MEKEERGKGSGGKERGKVRGGEKKGWRRERHGRRDGLARKKCEAYMARTI